MKSQISTLRFSQLFSPTPHGARLARLLASHQLSAWGWPPSCTLSESATLVVGELATNAVTHGRTRGRGFRLTITVDTAGAEPSLRIEVTDAQGDRLPLPSGAAASDPAAESGRGLLLVEALASRWGCEPWPPSGKTVWACLPLS